ncbi:protein of unknown function [Trichlorobacter ammonificans]|uniref:Uncharacterized protein n=1 Tax=Trichlorobacter ammonificans TaxID=2916410 RepID=A0ABM9D9V9_9BACT|nr:protein of unknown function [Trichlorobacter ammonificans]
MSIAFVTVQGGGNSGDYVQRQRNGPPPEGWPVALRLLCDGS